MTLAVLVAFMGALLSGCNNPAGNDGPPDPDDWEIRDTPQHVLDNLVRAYEEKDAVHYLDCLAEDFTFTVNPDDLENHPEMEPGYWDKAEERAIHEAMLGDGGAENIALTLTQDGDAIQVEGPNPGDPPEWQYKESVDLRVCMTLPDWGTVTFLANDPSLFQFRVDPDETGPNGETLWEIVSWHELSPYRDAAARGENQTWSSIKAMFR